MKNEKIFNAMEHLEDRFITEVMEQCGSDEGFVFEGENPVDPYAEGVVFNAEGVNDKNKSRFVKWAGLAAGVCAVAAGAVIMKNNGLFDGNISMPHNTLLDNTQVSYTTNVHDEPSKYSLEMLKEKFDLEALDITDYRIKDVLKSGEAVVEGDKVYFKENDVDGNAVICAYDIVQNEKEILTVNRESEDSANFRPHCIYNGWLYYTEYDSRSEKICRINLDTKEIEVIAPKSTDSSLIDNITFRDPTEGYLFFEEWTKDKTNEAAADVATVTVKSYNMENGEIKTVKENASVAMIHGDKLIYIDRSGNNNIKEIYFCNFDGSEEESLSDWIGSGLNVEHLSISARSDGEYIWEVSDPNSDSEGDGSGKRILMRLGKEEGLTPITNLEIIGYYYERDDGYSFECSNGYLWWRNTVYDTKNSELIKAGAYIEFRAIGSEVFCFDYSGYGTTKVYRFNFDLSENNVGEDEPSEFNIETMKESFNAEKVYTEDGIKEKLLRGLAAVQGNKIYYAVIDYMENVFVIRSYEKNEIETVGTDHFNNFEDISYDFIGIYNDSLYYRFCLNRYSADADKFYCIKKLNLSTGESEIIYNYTREPDLCGDRAVILDNYLFFEDTEPIDNIVRYDTESGNTIIFKENASAPASHKDKLIFCRRQDGKYGIYSCDLKSGENEEKLCDLSSNYVYPSVCSDGEKIWVSALDTSDDTFTVGYLDENYDFHPVKSSIDDLFPYEFKYADGYIVLHDIMIDVKSEDVIAIENVIAIGNELYYGEYQIKRNQRMKEYQTELYLYHLSKQ